jgi:hypothetical protein
MTYDQYKSNRQRREAYARRYKSEGKNIFGEPSTLIPILQAVSNAGMRRQAKARAARSAPQTIFVTSQDGTGWTGVKVADLPDGQTRLRVTDGSNSRWRVGQLVDVELGELRPVDLSQPPNSTSRFLGWLPGLLAFAAVVTLIALAIAGH